MGRCEISSGLTPSEEFGCRRYLHFIGVLKRIDELSDEVVDE